MKKLLLSLGAVTAVAAPVATVVSCGDDENKSTTLEFATTKNLFTAASFADGGSEVTADENINDNVADVIAETEDSELVSMVKKMASKDKVKLVIHYNDADLEVDAGVKLNGAEKVVVTVNKVYVTKKQGKKEDFTSNVKISAFKKHVKDILTSLVDLAKKEGLTSSDIKEAVKPVTE